MCSTSTSSTFHPEEVQADSSTSSYLGNARMHRCERFSIFQVSLVCFLFLCYVGVPNKYTADAFTPKGFQWFKNIDLSSSYSPTFDSKVSLSDPSSEIIQKSKNTSSNDWIMGLRGWAIPGDDTKSSNDIKISSNVQQNTTYQYPTITTESELRSNEPSASNESSSATNQLSRILNIETLLRFTDNTNDRPELEQTLAKTKMEQVKENESETGISVYSSKINVSSKVLDFSALVELSAWDEWRRYLWQTTNAIGWKSAEVIESLVRDASSAISYETIQELLIKSSYTVMILNLNQTTNTTSSNLVIRENQKSDGIDMIEFKEAAANVAMSRGLDITYAAAIAKETKDFAVSLLSVADGLLRKGYTRGDPIPSKQIKANNKYLANSPAVQGSQSLFEKFPSAFAINSYTPDVAKGAEMGSLAGAVYEETISGAHALGQSMVARGNTEDVAWMVTDSIVDPKSFELSDRQRLQESKQEVKPIIVRTITIKGYDASDVEVDRERLLNRIVSASPEKIRSSTRAVTVFAHSGLYKLARAIYDDIKQYIEWSNPSDKIVLNGHSVGGSISLLLLFLMVQERGAEFVRKKVFKVYTYGSPPVVRVSGGKSKSYSRNDYCEILDAYDLPASIVNSYVQPWDPIVRLFSEIDAFYPLLGDIGDDGFTVWANGPTRTLRPIAKAIMEAWSGWPEFRDIFKASALQSYTCVGIQHILLPEPTRYLADRFVVAKITVPPVTTIIRLSSSELYPALKTIFPLETFDVSFVPEAIRSFVHHFYPAYTFPIMDYVKELERRSLGIPERTSTDEFAFATKMLFNNDTFVESAEGNSEPNQGVGIDWRKAASWLIG